MDNTLFYAGFFGATVAVAWVAHTYIKRYVIASLVTAIVIPAILVGADSLYRGFVDSWATIAAVTSGAFALVTGLLVGIPIARNRKRKAAEAHVA